MEPEVPNDCGHEDERRGSPASTRPAIKAASLPASMSQTLAGIGGSVGFGYGKETFTSSSVTPSSTDDDYSDYIGARSFSQSSIPSEDSVATSVDSPLLPSSDLALEPRAYVDADVNPSLGARFHLRDRLRVDTWPTLSSNDLDFPYPGPFRIGNTAMAHNRHYFQRGEGSSQPISLPLRKDPRHPSLLSQALSTAHELSSQGDTNTTSNEDRHMRRKRIVDPSVHPPMLMMGKNLDLDEVGIVVPSGIADQDSLENGSTNSHRSTNSLRSTRVATTSLKDCHLQILNGQDQISNHQTQDEPYDKLAADMRNLVTMSEYGADIEEFGIPIDAHIHACLEQILNRSQAYKNAMVLESRLNELPQDKSSGYRIHVAADHDQASSSHGNGGKKRKNERDHVRRGQQHSDEEGDADGTGNNPDDVSSTMKRVREEIKGKLSCPFRKKNAIRFNVRDHPQCANQFYADLSMLKRHITSFHMFAMSQCPRCKLWFKTRDERDDHLMQDSASICTINEDQATHNQEDGITQQTFNRLTGRKNSTKVDTWEKLWHVLFSEEPLCPLPDFEPPVELDEVENIFLDKVNVKNFHDRLDQTSLSRAGPRAMFYDFQEYATNNLKKCHEIHGHCASRKRDDRIIDYLNYVRTMQHVFAQTHLHDHPNPLGLFPQSRTLQHNNISNSSDDSSQVTVTSSSEDTAQPSSHSSTSHIHSSIQGPESYNPRTLGSTAQVGADTQQFDPFQNPVSFRAAFSDSEYTSNHHAKELTETLCIFCRGQGVLAGCFCGRAQEMNVYNTIEQVDSNFLSDVNGVSTFIEDEGMVMSKEATGLENDFINGPVP